MSCKQRTVNRVQFCKSPFINTLIATIGGLFSIFVALPSFAACEGALADYNAVLNGNPTAVNYQSDKSRAEANLAACMQAEAQKNTNQPNIPPEELLVEGDLEAYLRQQEYLRQQRALERDRLAALEELKSLLKEEANLIASNVAKQPIQMNPAYENLGDHKTCLPVMIETGKKILTHIDFTENTEFPLHITRNYSSYDGSSYLFGHRWSTKLDRHLMFSFKDGRWCNFKLNNTVSTACSSTKNSDTLKKIYLNNTTQFSDEFIFSASTSRWTTTEANNKNLVLTQLTDQRWKLENKETGETEIFGLNGRLESIINRHSLSWVLGYDSTSSNKLQSITHSSGKILRLEWGTNSHISKVTDTDNKVIVSA
ncbi:DUF6531 domain-containing protein [Cellvibrio japonicus]|uniref:DUF6531 domain-containing protein n=1 Tax=Cellvibrio japonicus (strain Ueda107) TaxID=498211 RepID=B3PC40_CELJU|nr:DUF6531 domain-containing protein [Cellvibrio japonicus]ACE83212.1 hypothetical protein CJA_2853 [Cellvibrio japonicus Ueda107]QEI13188.1 hypothetical protein FY117_13775 [Cellvibrio japonicus]QEI16762.1 hypothetical protein FY116_13780 [Cellvibrio japonicus]QEI20340.1 hypothetical protein FY115_13775 [Cellvibrio japonicus]